MPVKLTYVCVYLRVCMCVYMYLCMLYICMYVGTYNVYDIVFKGPF